MAAALLTWLKDKGLTKVDGFGKLNMIPNHSLDPFYG